MLLIDCINLSEDKCHVLVCLHSKWRGQGGLIKVQAQLCAAVVFGCAVRQSCSPTKFSMF